MSHNLVHFRPHLLRRRHLALLVAAMDAVQDSLSRSEVLAAAGRFFATEFIDGAALAGYLRDRDAHSQFYPWLLWDAELKGGTLGERLLARRARRHRDDRALLTALHRAEPEAYEVGAQRDGVTELIRLRDGVKVEVTEPVLDAVSARGELMVARVLELPECWLLDGVHVVLPASTRRGLVRAARRAAEASRERRLPILMQAAQRALHRLCRRTPQLRTPDGMPLLRASLTLEVHDTRALHRALEALCAIGRIEALPNSGDFALVDPSLGAVGARLRLRGGRLTASTRSLARAERLARNLPVVLPMVAPRLTVIRDLGTLLDDGSEPFGDGIDVARMTRDWVEEYLLDLGQQPLAALDGATPVEAMKTTTGRGRVRAFLRALEPLTDVAGPECRRSLDTFWANLSRGSALTS